MFKVAEYVIWGVLIMDYAMQLDLASNRRALVNTYRTFHHTRSSGTLSCHVLEPEDGGREAPSRPFGLTG
jgi:hypothetical protein